MPQTGSASAREAVMTVTATPLERVELTRTISMNGSVYAWQDVIIASEVGGYRVAEVFVDVGDRVRKGQRLVSLSTALLASRSRDQASDVEAARSGAHERAVVARARPESSRRRTYCRKPISTGSPPSSWRRSRALDSARADLETSQLRLKFTERARRPTTASITSRTVTVGQIAQAGSEMLRLLAQRPHRVAR